MSDADLLSWLPVDLVDVAFRLARADELAYQLGNTISEWAASDPVTVGQVQQGA